MDAMGCRPRIAAKIVDEGCGLLLAVEGKSTPRFTRESRHFSWINLEDDFATNRSVCLAFTQRSRHVGRIDERIYYLCEVPDDLSDGHAEDLCCNRNVDQ